MTNPCEHNQPDTQLLMWTMLLQLLTLWTFSLMLLSLLSLQLVLT